MRVLAIGAHPDDIELGAGGTIARHVARGHEVTMAVLTDGRQGQDGSFGRRSEQAGAAAVLGAEVVWGSFEDCAVSQDEHGLVRFIQRVVQETGADIVYTHALADTHQDHVAVARASLGATRKLSRVLAYESPSALNFMPDMFVDVSDTLGKKIEALHHHSSQVNGSATIDIDAIQGQAAYYGFKARVPAAEGFLVIRYLLDV